jgi:hypothetical protein
MPQRYQVVGACVLITQDGMTGPVKHTLFRGAPIGPGAKDWEIEHNLLMGLIRAIEVEDGLPGVNAQGEPVIDSPGGSAQGEPVIESGDGSVKPARNAPKPVLVAWVADNRGMTAADAEKLTTKDLWKRIDGDADPALPASDAEAELAELRKQAVAKGYGQDAVDKANLNELKDLLV